MEERISLLSIKNDIKELAERERVKYLLTNTLIIKLLTDVSKSIKEIKEENRENGYIISDEKEKDILVMNYHEDDYFNQNIINPLQKVLNNKEKIIVFIDYIEDFFKIVITYNKEKRIYLVECLNEDEIVMTFKINNKPTFDSVNMKEVKQIALIIE